MAEHADFQESNMTWAAPKGAANVQDMRALRTFSADHGAMVNVTAWKLAPEEVIEVARTGVVWLSVLGNAMPPVLVLGVEPPQVVAAREEGKG